MWNLRRAVVRVRKRVSSGVWSHYHGRTRCSAQALRAFSSSAPDTSQDLLALINTNIAGELGVGKHAAPAVISPNALATPIPAQPATLPGAELTWERKVELDEAAMNVIRMLLSERPSVDVHKDDRYLKALPSDLAEFFLEHRRDTSQYNKLLRVLNMQGLVQDGEKLLQDMAARGIARDGGTFNELIALCSSDPSRSLAANEAYKNRATALVEDMPRHGLTPNAVNYGTLMQTYCKLGFVDDAVQLLRDKLEEDTELTNSTSFTQVISALTKRGEIADIEVAWDLYQECMNHNVHIAPPLYNTMLRVAAQHEEAEKALSIHNRMLEEYIEPSVYTYANLIYAIGQRHDYYHKAFEYLREMVTNGYQPNAYIMSNLLYCCGRHGDLRNAIKLFDEADTLYKVTKTTVMYNNLFKVFGKVAVYTGVNLGEEEAVSREKRIVMAHGYLHEMKENGVPVDMITCNTLFSVYCRSNLVSRAENAYSKLFSDYGFKPDIYSYRALLRMYNSTLAFPESFSVLERMIAAGVEPDQSIYNSLLHVCKKTINWKAGVEVIYDMRQKGFEPPRQLARHFMEAPAIPQLKGKPHLRNKPKSAKQIQKDKDYKYYEHLDRREQTWKESIPRKHSRAFPHVRVPDKLAAPKADKLPSSSQ